MLEWSKGSERELHPAGEWRAQFVEWKEDKHQSFGIQVKLTFDTECLMEDGQPFRISTWAKPSLHPKGKVAKMLAALGVDVEAISDEDLKKFTLDDYCSQKLRIVVTHEPKKDSDELADRITGFLPFKKPGVRTAVNFGDDTPETSGDKAAQAEPAKEPVAAATGAAKPDWNDED